MRLTSQSKRIAVQGRSLSNNNAERDAKGLLRNEMELRTKYRVYKYKYRSLSNNNV